MLAGGGITFPPSHELIALAQETIAAANALQEVMRVDLGAVGRLPIDLAVLPGGPMDIQPASLKSGGSP